MFAVTATTYDPETTKRLIAETMEDDARMMPAPWTTDDKTPCVYACGGTTEVAVMGDGKNNYDGDGPGIARTRNNLRAMAYQLEAAQIEVQRLTAELAKPAC